MSFILKKSLEALDILVEYPDISEYIKTFDGEGGFMYTIEKDATRKELNKRMGDLLDDGFHSGSTWGLMLRNVQSVLNGTITKEKMLEEIEREERQYKDFKERHEAEKREEAPVCYGELDVSALSEDALKFYKRFVVEQGHTAAEFVIKRFPYLFEYVSNNRITINAGADQVEESFPDIVIVYEDKKEKLRQGDIYTWVIVNSELQRMRERINAQLQNYRSYVNELKI